MKVGFLVETFQAKMSEVLTLVDIVDPKNIPASEILKTTPTEKGGMNLTEKILSIGAITGSAYIVRKLLDHFYPEMPTVGEIFFGKEMTPPPKVEVISKQQLNNVYDQYYENLKKNPEQKELYESLLAGCPKIKDPKTGKEVADFSLESLDKFLKMGQMGA